MKTAKCLEIAMIQEQIEAKLSKAFAPYHLDVINESYMHNVPVGSESHFKVVIVSDEFHGKRLIARHRLVNQVLESELKNGVHALSMHTYTLDEWKMNTQIPQSPMCQGGGK